MFIDRILSTAFIISLFTHGAVLLQSSGLNPFIPPPKEQSVVVRYIKDSRQPKPLPKITKDFNASKRAVNSDPFLNLEAKIGAGSKGRVPPPYVTQQNSLSSNRALMQKPADFPKPAFAGTGFTAIKKRISLPEIKMAKIDNPSYISYYQIVREKIRRSAYQNYISNEKGEVYLSFIIARDGALKEVRLSDEKSSVNHYLKDLALRSLQDAAPFPSFPKELDYPQLSFNIIISFEIE